MTLSFGVNDDLSRATGREELTFTPDRRICEVVFRAWPNRPSVARGGGRLIVTAATVNGTAVTPTVSSAGAPAGAPGTLVELPLAGCSDAGTRVDAALDFELVLGRDADEFVGHSTEPAMAWFATGYPLLAWVRGAGWARDDAVRMGGETATSEEFRLTSLAVTAPGGMAVLGTGVRGEVSVEPSGRRTHRFSAESVRDVAVSVGDLEVVDRRIGTTTLHLGYPRRGNLRVEPEAWVEEFDSSLRALSDLLGPFPYPELWATIIPAQHSGLEFPSALQFGNLGNGSYRETVQHELAHQWFYSLVGNNQARDPWLDESFATFAEAVASGREDQFQLSDDSADGEHSDEGEEETEAEEPAATMGRPMEFWAANGGFERYEQSVYLQGAAVLLEARRRAGPERFDAALREFVRTNAHQVADEQAVQQAFGGIPDVVELLRARGAFDSSAKAGD